jgi:pyruvate dehydrogenase (quinone)/pyruvate oxidase
MLLEAYSVAATDRARSRYSWERIAHETVAVYDGALDAAAALPSALSSYRPPPRRFGPPFAGQGGHTEPRTEAPVTQIASEALAERLIDWKVDTVFGLPGDGINGIMEGLRRHKDQLRFVLVHHEEAAAFMATAYAKATGKIGVCLATSGPGGIHLLNGLCDAKLDHAPVLAITGMQETSVLGTGYQQEVALDKLYSDVAEYDQMISNPVQIPAVTDLAIRTAYARRGVAHITVPNDIQVADAGADPWQHVAPASAPKTAAVYLPPPGLPSAEDLQRLADFLNDGRKIAILAGAGALHAREELLATAEALGAPIVKTLSGKAAVPDDSPYTTGGIGLLGTKPSEELMDQIDTLFMVGTNFPYTKHLPQQARTAQIEADPARAGARIPTELPLVGDAKQTLRGLLPLLKQRSDTSFLTKYQQEMAVWRQKMASLEDVGREPIAAVPDGDGERARRRRRHPHLRQRHDRHLGRAALDDPRRPPVLPVGQPRHHGAGSAVRDRDPARLP